MADHEIDLDAWIASAWPPPGKMAAAVRRASDHEEITWITSGGTRVAAIVPAGLLLSDAAKAAHDG